jgi:hypothetical protein
MTGLPRLHSFLLVFVGGVGGVVRVVNEESRACSWLVVPRSGSSTLVDMCYCWCVVWFWLG